MRTAYPPFQSEGCPHQCKTWSLFLLHRSLLRVWWRMGHEQTAVPQWGCWSLGISQWNHKSVLSWSLSSQALCVPRGALHMNARSCGKCSDFFAIRSDVKIISFVLKVCSFSTKSAIDFSHPCSFRFKVFKFPKMSHRKLTSARNCSSNKFAARLCLHMQRKDTISWQSSQKGTTPVNRTDHRYDLAMEIH